MEVLNAKQGGLDCKAGEQWGTTAEMNHVVEEFMQQMGLGMKDRKEEVNQEAIM